jgi:putative membrane protein insertion efficiency factor
MRHLLPTQRPFPDPLGDYRAGASGERRGSQSGEATPAGGFPTPPRGHPGRMGHCLESAPRGSERPVPDAGSGNPASFPQSGGTQIFGGAAAPMKPAALALIRFYQACLSPVLPSACRYYPSCSTYAYEAVEKWGLWQGVGMAFRRLLRCRPFGGHGYDPIP